MRKVFLPTFQIYSIIWGVTYLNCLTSLDFNLNQKAMILQKIIVF